MHVSCIDKPRERHLQKWPNNRAEMTVGDSTSFWIPDFCTICNQPKMIPSICTTSCANRGRVNMAHWQYTRKLVRLLPARLCPRRVKASCVGEGKWLRTIMIDWLLWININRDWLIDVTPWGRENLFPSGVEKDLDRCDRRYLRPKNVRVAEKLWYSDTEAGPTSILKKSWFIFTIAEWQLMRLISRIYWSADYWSLNDSVIEWAEDADRDENI